MLCTSIREGFLKETTGELNLNRKKELAEESTREVHTGKRNGAHKASEA